MTTQATPAVPEIFGIDLTFRPRAYFLPQELDNVTHLAHIAGHARRELARDLLAAGRDDLPPEMLAELLDDVTRIAFGKIHPMCMGGEYLPPLNPDEIEIARISLDSVTADQISVRAQKRDDHIEYRIVDEYGDCSYTEYVCQPQTSRHPLTLGNLIAMIESACDRGVVFNHIVGNIECGGEHPLELENFVTVSSEFYWQLDVYYQSRIESFFDQYRELDEDEDPESIPAASPERHE
jgi:hypothetical protein